VIEAEGRPAGHLLSVIYAVAVRGAGRSQMQIGERTFTIGCIRDISERKERAERDRRSAQALHREAQRGRVAFEEAPIGSVLAARNGRIERVNQALCAMTGHTPDELIGRHFSELTHPEDRDRSATVVAALLNGAGAQHLEKRYLHSSGRVIEGACRFRRSATTGRRSCSSSPRSRT
jgi:PAS domain S-box-containing protein